MSDTLTYFGTLKVLHCWCGARFAVPEELQRAALDRGHTVYCPLGHTCHWGDTREKKLARELEETRRRERATRDLLDAEERSHIATKGHLTRQKKRASAGVCPCCNRTFQQLARHMKSKHPNYTKGDPRMTPLEQAPAQRWQVELGPFDSLQAAQEADSPIFARCENDYGIRIVGYDEHGDVVGVVPWGEAG